MIGAVVLSTDQGLGYLAKDFDKHLFDKVLIRRHSSRENHPEWFKNWKWLDESNYDWFFEDLTSIVYIEDPFVWKMIPKARARGIKNVLIPMYECTRDPLPYEFDLILAPSYLDFRFYQSKNPVYLPIPTTEPYKKRTTATHFVHNAGNGGLGGRNGTKELLEAMKYVETPIRLTVHYQTGEYTSPDSRVTLKRGNFDKSELYKGDVFVFPEKFNGLSLPINEAWASGMAVMTTDRFPFNEWLPKELLIPVASYKKERISTTFDSAVIDPKDIAIMIDRWFGQEITDYTVSKKWIKEHSWANLKQKYENYLK